MLKSNIYLNDVIKTKSNIYLNDVIKTIFMGTSVFCLLVHAPSLGKLRTI